MLDHCFEFYESRWRRFFESKRRSKSLKAAWQPIYHSIDRYIQQWSERRGCGIKNCLAVGEAGSCPSGVSSSRLYDTSTSAQVLLLAAASWGQPTMCCSSRREAAEVQDVHSNCCRSLAKRGEYEYIYVLIFSIVLPSLTVPQRTWLSTHLDPSLSLPPGCDRIEFQASA